MVFAGQKEPTESENAYNRGKDEGRKEYIRDEYLGQTLQTLYSALGMINRVADTGLVKIDGHYVISAQHHIHQARRALEDYERLIVRARKYEETPKKRD